MVGNRLIALLDKARKKALVGLRGDSVISILRLLSCFNYTTREEIAVFRIAKLISLVRSNISNLF